MKPDLVTCSEVNSCSRITTNSGGQYGWTGRVIVHLLLLQLLVFTSEGCTKSHSYDASTSRVPYTTTTASLPNTSSSTSASSHHRLPCSPKQVLLAGCLNGGSCFATELHNSSSNVSHCSCTSDWTGERCEYRYIDPHDWAVYLAQKRLQQICIGIGTGTVVLLAGILISFALYKRKRSREANSSTTTSGNSSTGNNSKKRTNLCTDEQKT